MPALVSYNSGPMGLVDDALDRASLCANKTSPAIASEAEGQHIIVAVWDFIGLLEHMVHIIEPGMSLSMHNKYMKPSSACWHLYKKRKKSQFFFYCLCESSSTN